MPLNHIKIKLKSNGQASIYTAELCAIQLALDVVNNSNEDKYIICVDSLSCLQAIEHHYIDHPLVLDVLEKYSALINKTVLFCWIPSHVGIRGNELADAAAKAALNETLTIMTLPYSDFKPLVKRFIRGKWSDFWATQINNKLGRTVSNSFSQYNHTIYSKSWTFLLDLVNTDCNLYVSLVILE